MVCVSGQGRFDVWSPERRDLARILRQSTASKAADQQRPWRAAFASQEDSSRIGCAATCSRHHVAAKGTRGKTLFSRDRSILERRSNLISGGAGREAC